MGWNDHIDFDLVERIRNAEELGFFEGNEAACGIVKRAADGLPLSEKQQYVFDTIALPILSKPQSEQEELDAAMLDRDPLD